MPAGARFNGVQKANSRHSRVRGMKNTNRFRHVRFMTKIAMVGQNRGETHVYACFEYLPSRTSKPRVSFVPGMCRRNLTEGVCRKLRASNRQTMLRLTAKAIDTNVPRPSSAGLSGRLAGDKSYTQIIPPNGTPAGFSTVLSYVFISIEPHDMPLKHGIQNPL